VRPGSRRRSRLRISLAVLAVLAVVCVFVVRLVDIQVVQAQELNAQSYDKRAVPITLYGTRGNIVDANGDVLALSVDRFDITASPRVALGSEDLNGPVLEALTRVAAITGGDPAAILLEFQADPESDFAYIAKGVTLEVYRQVMDLEIGWIVPQLHPSRTYPNGAVAGNLVGFTNGDGAGVERSESECLASTDGEAVYERGENGIPLPGSVVTTQQPVDGGTLHLTIDRDLQWYVQQRMAQTYAALGASWVTAVVIRISDGHLMAVADYPSVDPNNVDGVGPGDTGSRAFSTPFEPGSIMKPLSASELLDSGVATQASPVTAPGRLYLSDGSYIKDSFAHDDINYTLTGVLVDSSNTGISLLSQQLSADTRHDYLEAYGLGSETEVAFNGESAGILNDAVDWDERTNLSVQFGQGLATTAVQMASIYQTLGNGGVRMPVTLVEGCEQPDGTMTDLPGNTGTRVVSETAANQVLEMMEKVATEGGARNDLQIPGYRVAAKSGTAEVAENGAYGDGATISFAGVAPVDDPQYAVVVTAVLPTSIYTSGAMASTFTDVMAQTLKTFRVTPSTTPAPDLPLTW
jgi:cell division protein FtsI (penicillin-binding protein 3)